MTFKEQIKAIIDSVQPQFDTKFLCKDNVFSVSSKFIWPFFPKFSKFDKPYSPKFSKYRSFETRQT